MRQNLRLWQSFYCALIYGMELNHRTAGCARRSGCFCSRPNGNIQRILISFPATSGFAFMFSCHISRWARKGKKMRRRKPLTTVDDQQHSRVEMCHVLIFPRELLHRLPIYQSEEREKHFFLFILPFLWMKNFFTTSARGRREALEADCVSRDVNIIQMIIMESFLASGVETAIDRTRHIHSNSEGLCGAHKL